MSGLDYQDPIAAGIANEFLYAATNLVAYWWRLRLEGFVPPPVGAFAGGSGPRWDSGRGKVRRTRERSCAEPSTGAVGDDEIVGGSGDGDDAPVVQPMVIRAYQHQVAQLGGTAVFPVPDVVCVQTAGGPTAGNRARGMAVLERAAKPPVDQPGRSAGADDLPVTFEPDFTGGITGQVFPFGVGQQRAQMQCCGALLNIDVGHHGGVMPVRAAGRLGVPPGFDQAHKRLDRGRQRGQFSDVRSPSP